MLFVIGALRITLIVSRVIFGPDWMFVIMCVEGMMVFV